LTHAAIGLSSALDDEDADMEEAVIEEPDPAGITVEDDAGESLGDELDETDPGVFFGGNAMALLVRGMK
jgi:hypothetical protein